MKASVSPTIHPLRLTFAETVSARPGEGYTRPDWDCWTFEYILSGKGTLQVDGNTYTPEEGDLYVLPRGMAHSYWADEKAPWEKRFFVVDGPVVSHLLAAYRLDATYYVPDCNCKRWFDELHDLKKNGSDDSTSRATILFHRLLIQLATDLSRNTPGYSSAIRKAIGFLNSNIETPVRMDEVASAAGRSKSHLSRTFHEEVGVSPYDYLIHLRMDQAKSLLALTPFTIADIAERLCYADAYYFSNAFKQRFGMSPRAFREGA